ncbi:MAG: chloride channel protein [Bacteroidetes bacterium 4572_114]|nr:MAG: chloride channel protein [Bacteroidetes bacterium 4572_114]
MKKTGLFGKLLIWRVRHIKDRQFVIFLSLIIGILSGLAAIILKNLVYYTHYFMTNGFRFTEENYWYFAYPMAGILLTVLFVKYIVKDNLGHGVSRILYAISKKNGVIKSHNTYSSMISSSLTIGFGGSVGLEAPIVLTGSAIGSNLGRLFRLNYKTIILLIGCGSAGAIAGIFKAPIAGVVFAIEVLMLDLTMVALIPLLIAAVTGATVAYLLLGNDVLFSFDVTTPFILNEIPFFILLGIFSGLVSYYFTWAAMYIEGRFGKVKNSYLRLIFGGAILGLLIFIFPSLFGEGYEALMDILHGEGGSIINQSIFKDFIENKYLFLLLLLLILIFKVIAMAATTGSGGVGGIFAPSLFMGGVSGFFVARFINSLTPFKVSESNFSLVGMAGIMAGVMHAPLTAIFLIAEITGGYELLPPLIITATISYLTINYFEPHSIYTKRLAQRGELMTHHKDKAVLSMMKVKKLIETNFNPIHPDATLGDLVKVISSSSRNIIPVVDEDGTFCGLIFMDHIREIIFKPEIYRTTFVRNLMFMPETTVSQQESMEAVAQKFQKTGKFNLVVLKDGKYIGFISRARVFSAYRKLLKDFSDD